MARISSLIRTIARIAALTALALALLVPGTASAHPTRRAVLPPNARPHGYSLAEMTRRLALFTTSGNDPKYEPRTPFQILYYDPATLEVDTSNGGWAFRGTNSFKVKSGTEFFVPLQNASDSPPVPGTFPRTPVEAKAYFFVPSQLGARGYTIIVDGVPTRIGPEYLAGPVKTPPLLDGDGTHMITLGAFLGPLSPGSHIVSIRGGLYGDLLSSTYDIGFLSEDFTYRVTVGPNHRDRVR